MKRSSNDYQKHINDNYQVEIKKHTLQYGYIPDFNSARFILMQLRKYKRQSMILSN